MSQEEDKNPTAADRQVTLEGEEAEILAGMANQSTELETLRTELLNANRKISELTLRLLGNEETPGGVMTPVTSTPRRVTIAPQGATAFPLSDPPEPKPADTAPRTFAIKAKDIPMLKLSDIDGLGAEARVDRFIEMVEYCVANGDDRIQVANTRLEFETITLLKQQMTTSSDSSWKNFKEQLKVISRGTKLHEDAFGEIMATTYHPDEMPRTFANQLRCKLAAFALRFPDEPMPKPERMIKEKLLAGMPSAKTELGHCHGEEYPLAKFLDMFESARRRTRTEQGRPVWKVTPNPQSTGASVPAPEASNHTDMQKFEQKVEQLLESLKNAAKNPRPRRTWCPYCRSGDHFLKDCPHNPPRGVCFDCQSPDHRRGAPNCPGNGGQNN